LRGDLGTTAFIGLQEKKMGAGSGGKLQNLGPNHH